MIFYAFHYARKVFLSSYTGSPNRIAKNCRIPYLLSELQPTIPVEIRLGAMLRKR